MSVRNRPNSPKMSPIESLQKNSLEIVCSIVLGIVFGVLMNKSNIHLPSTIRDQMLFKRLTMIKMFLSAVGMSMLSVVCLLIINRSIYDKIFNGFVQKVNRIDGKEFDKKNFY